MQNSMRLEIFSVFLDEWYTLLNTVQLNRCWTEYAGT